MQLAQSSRDELRVLRSEIEHEDELMAHERGSAGDLPPLGRCSASRFGKASRCGYYSGVEPCEGVRDRHRLVARIACTTAALALVSGLGSRVAGRAPQFPGQILLQIPQTREPAPSTLTLPLVAEWRTRLPAPGDAKPAFDARHAYVPTRDGRLIAVALETGLVGWVRDLQVTRDPAAGGERIFVVTDAAVYALHAADGRTAWELPFPVPLAVAPYWDTGWLILATAEGEVMGLRATDREIIWRVALGSPARARPATGGDRLHVPLEDGRIVALSLRNGSILWERKLGGPPTPPAATSDAVYVGSLDNALYCLDGRDGRIRWRWLTGADIVGAPAMDASHVYFNSLDNVLRALNRRTGSQRWKEALPTRAASGPVQVGESLLVAGLSSRIRAYATRDGAPLGEYDALDELFGPPHAIERPEPFESRLVLMLGTGELVRLQQLASPMPVLTSSPPGVSVLLDALAPPPPPLTGRQPQ